MRQLRILANRAGRGEQEAADQLRQLLAPQMVTIVRRALRVGQGVSALERRILAEAERVQADNPDRPLQGENLVQQVAQRVCDGLVRGGGQAASLTRCLGETAVV